MHRSGTPDNIAALVIAGADFDARDKERATEMSMSNPQGLKQCPSCAEDIKLEAVVCRYCGRDLEPTPVEPQK